MLGVLKKLSDSAKARLHCGHRNAGWAPSSGCDADEALWVKGDLPWRRAPAGLGEASLYIQLSKGQVL